MSSLSTNHNCRVCNRPAIISQSILNTKEINGVEVGENYYYCSPICRNTDQRRRWNTFGGVIIVVGLLFILLEIVTFGIILLLTGSISMGYAVIRYPKNEELYSAIQADLDRFMEMEELAEMTRTSEDSAGFIETSGSSDYSYSDPDLLTMPEKQNPQNNRQVFSEILEKYVDPCCYQTVRLEDRYCMCGKAIDYPHQE